MQIFKLFVSGRPHTKGSVRAFNIPGKRYSAIVNSDPKAKKWEQVIKLNAKQVYHGDPVDYAVSVVITFQFNKPKSANRLHHTVRPDVDKLTRCALDALTGVVYKDDCQIVACCSIKKYSEYEGVHIVISKTEEAV